VRYESGTQLKVGRLRNSSSKEEGFGDFSFFRVNRVFLGKEDLSMGGKQIKKMERWARMRSSRESQI
jgi:hypothetical protein